MYLTTHVQIAQFKQLDGQLTRFRERLADSEQLEEDISELKRRSCRKKHRRPDKDIVKSFRCPYDNCFRSYGSDVSMNLHIKGVHNGGTKTERHNLAVPKPPLRNSWSSRCSAANPCPPSASTCRPASSTTSPKITSHRTVDPRPDDGDDTPYLLASRSVAPGDHPRVLHAAAAALL